MTKNNTSLVFLGAAIYAGYIINKESKISVKRKKIIQRNYGKIKSLNSSSSFGLSIDKNGVYISDWAKWMEVAPQAFENAISDGARGADGVLIHVLRRVLPRVQWPPPEGTAEYAQFWKMVEVVAQNLQIDPEPEPLDNRRLTLIK